MRWPGGAPRAGRPTLDRSGVRSVFSAWRAASPCVGLAVRGLKGVGGLEVLALDVDVRQPPVEPRRQPPRPPAEQGHHGGHQGHPDHERVHQDTDGQGQADGLRDRVDLQDEAAEHRDHDQRGRRDNPSALAESGDDRLPGLPRVDVALAHPRDEEDLVVHGEAEQHTDQEDRQEARDRPFLRHVEQIGEMPVLEDRHHDSERCSDAQEEPERRLDRHDDRPEDDHQQQQGQPDDDSCVERQRLGQPVGRVDVDRGRASDENLDAGLVLHLVGTVAELCDQVLGLARRGTRLRGHRQDGDALVGVLHRWRDGRHAGEGLQTGGRLLRHLGLLLGAQPGCVHHDREWAVEPGAEALVQQVVGLPLGRRRRVGPGVGETELDVGGRSGDRDQSGDPAQQDQPGPLGDERGPAHGGLGLAGPALAQPPGEQPVGPAEAVAREAQQCRKQGERDENGDRDRGGCRQPHHGEEGDVDDHQPDQGDHHGEPREDDGTAGGGRGTCRRFARLQTVLEVLPVSRQDEQGVVDPDGQSEHGRQGGGDRGHGDDV